MELDELHTRVWRGRTVPTSRAVLATGVADLDRHLPGGGWPTGALIEILVDGYGIGELALLMPALATLTHPDPAKPPKWIAWVGPPFVPYAPALEQHGVSVERLLMIHPGEGQKNRLWSVEQVIRSGSSAGVLAWLASAEDVILPVVPMFHVNAWGTPYFATMNGTKLVLPGAQLDGKSIYELFESEKVTVSQGVPTVWLGLLAYMREHKLKFSTLNRVVVGGSACPPAMLREFRDSYGVRCIHAWGMTEMSPLGSFSTLKSKHDGMGEEQKEQILFKQGRAIFGVDMKIVDDDGQHIGGRSVRS